MFGTRAGGFSAVTSSRHAGKQPARNPLGMLAAVDRSMAVIEFAPSGHVLVANENFCAAMGVTLEEIAGKHHSLFMPSPQATSEDYRRFWEKLNRGEFVAGEFKRIAKGGREIWLQASYNPVLDKSGRVERVVKFATDITDQKHKSIDATGQIEAISRSQAVIEFDLNGVILTANENFCATMGYGIDEIRGQHHRMFVTPRVASSHDYTRFWDGLRTGKFQQAEYERVGRGGRTVWIQATYNPIRDADGKVVKVVKFATDITKAIEARHRNERLAVDIEKDIAAIVANVGSVLQQTTEVAIASDDTSSTIQSAAAATEELSASINEISNSVSMSKNSADRALDLTRTADTQTAALTKSTDQMTGIVELIDVIASQINLLALNATIESARAGEAGRGFAVVASEVKQLAAQVSTATKTISAEIRGVQAVSGNVVTSLRNIQQAVVEITGSFSSVAAAVEQQSAATSEISSTMQAASMSIGSINRLVGNIAASMGETSDTASRAAGQVRANIQAMVA